MRDTLVKSYPWRHAHWTSLAAICGAIALGACSKDTTESEDSASSQGGASGDGGSATGGFAQLSDSGSSHQSEAGEGSGQAGSVGSGCGESKLESTKRPVNLLLVIDRSASMDAPPRDVATGAPALGAAGATGMAGGANGKPNSGNGAGSGSGDVAPLGGAGGASGELAASDATKWELLKTQLVDSLDRVKADLSFGMLLFPASEELEPSALWCEMSIGSSTHVPVTSGAEAIVEIDAVLDDTPPAGNTPTAAALEKALEYFTTGEGSELEGDNYVILATDGGPNCNYDTSCDADRCIPNIGGVDCGGSGVSCCTNVPDQCIDDEATTDALESLKEAGVKTFIVGIPGSELFSGFLDDFAEAGGMPREPTSDAPQLYYKVEAEGNMQGLSSVLVAITGSLIKRCDLQLEDEPPDVAQLNVYVDGVVVPQAGDDGWTVDIRTSPPTIKLKGETCRRLETEGAGSVSIQYGCPTVIVL